ncbi:unnamed protein product [Oncorhynchus mykiss]|uniref:G-protein coupled receptors family 1 profile domain-containing protein n=1 Tax=Oncorhynchus mykiss TaxID=8022 RepID=A0A060YQQ5_ONCMY|nr:unnamed protein product [Oncorhynchus mykiss]
MNLNVSGLWEELPVNSSVWCPYDVIGWEPQMEQLYFWFYLLLFIPGLCLNTTALWVLCRHISKKTKAVIFMVNLALADLLHVMSLPLRIHYYLTHTWPFGQTLCLFCFYLKYLNMYASITFLVCISVQRCVFLLQPFYARRWRRRYDLLISATVWLVVGIGCSPFIIMRISNSTVPSQYTPSPSTSLIPSSNPSHYTGSPIQYSTTSTLPYTSSSPTGCFKDLPTRKLPLPLMDKDKRRALRMVMSCSALFLFCFAPYHINFLLYVMVSQDIVSHCPTMLVVRHFHPVSLCVASLSCCLNPLLYYFLTAEFRQHLSQRTSSLSSSIRGRLMSLESTSSFRE